jgi:hypothetical protein
LSTGIIRTTAEEEQTSRISINREAPREVIACCPLCKTMETLDLSGDGMAPSRRFAQKDGEVFHTCGSLAPCRLYTLRS